MSDMSLLHDTVGKTAEGFSMFKLSIVVFAPAHKASDVFSALEGPGKLDAFLDATEDVDKRANLERFGEVTIRTHIFASCKSKTRRSAMASAIAQNISSLPFLAMVCLRAGTNIQTIEEAKIIYRLVGWLRSTSGDSASQQWVKTVLECYLPAAISGWNQHRMRVEALAADGKLKWQVATQAPAVPTRSLSLPTSVASTSSVSIASSPTPASSSVPVTAAITSVSPSVVPSDADLSAILAPHKEAAKRKRIVYDNTGALEQDRESRSRATSSHPPAKRPKNASCIARLRAAASKRFQSTNSKRFQQR